MSGWLRADRIQGSVSPGFAKDEQAFLWLRFPSASSARAWLKETVPQLTSAGEVLAFRALRAKLLAQSGPVDLRSTWVNVAFSRAGLDLLVPAPAGTFPEPFEQGMAARAVLLGDTPATWRFGGTPDTEAHALVIIGADTEADLLEALDVHRERLARHGARDIFLEILGATVAARSFPASSAGTSISATGTESASLPSMARRARETSCSGIQTRPERCRAPDRPGRGTAAISSSGGSIRTWPDSTRPSTS